MTDKQEEPKCFYEWQGRELKKDQERPDGLFKTLSKRQKKEDLVRVFFMSSKHTLILTAIFMTPILYFGSSRPKQMDLTFDAMNLDIDVSNWSEYFSR